MPVTPFYRSTGPTARCFDYSNDDHVLRAEIAKLNPEDVAGYRRFLDYAAASIAKAM
jgi:phytoene desaturase